MRFLALRMTGQRQCIMVGEVTNIDSDDLVADGGVDKVGRIDDTSISADTNGVGAGGLGLMRVGCGMASVEQIASD